METVEPPRNDGSGSHIDGLQLRVVDLKERFNSNRSGGHGRFRHAAEVEFETEKIQIIIDGRVKSGGRSCRKTVLESATYDEENDILTVVVFDNFDESADACTAEIALVPYTATVTMNSTLPRTVIVEHRDDRQGIVFNETFTR